ncbi:MAG TPA: transporter [Verrucomicrobiota bacterium]|nr:transporter [Verrucomicrobiota bacterium]
MKHRSLFHRNTRPILAQGAMVCTLSFPLNGAAADKDQFTLFNPTPRDLMRPMSTDRPDLTESPFTVDAGHFQIELDAINYAYDCPDSGNDRVRTDSYSVASVNLKLGLLNRLDLQLLLAPWNYVRTEDKTAGSVHKQCGFGDITARLKFNLWGNDGGNTTLALMPFVTFPTSDDGVGNSEMAGGIIVPFAMELPAGWGMGAMTEVDFVEDSDGNGHHAEFINTITFGRDIVDALAGYVEFFSAVSVESDSDWIGSVNFGFTYALSEDMQLDAGLNIGVTRSADDLNPFAGFSWRY